MKILVACEFSGRVRNEFLRKGHDVISCDLRETELSGPHYQGDVYDILYSEKWDMIIAFPDCTKLCVSGNGTYGYGKPRYSERLYAIRWTEQFWNDCTSVAPKVVFENPVGVLSTSTRMGKPYYIHPWYFGHPETKKTGLWLYNLPPLISTRICIQRENRIWKMPPSQDRGKLRSLTYPGIARAMAEQWG